MVGLILFTSNGKKWPLALPVKFVDFVMPPTTQKNIDWISCPAVTLVSNWRTNFFGAFFFFIPWQIPKMLSNLSHQYPSTHYRLYGGGGGMTKHWQIAWLINRVYLLPIGAHLGEFRVNQTSSPGNAKFHYGGCIFRTFQWSLKWSLNLISPLPTFDDIANQENGSFGQIPSSVCQCIRAMECVSKCLLQTEMADFLTIQHMFVSMSGTGVKGWIFLTFAIEWVLGGGGVVFGTS